MFTVLQNMNIIAIIVILVLAIIIAQSFESDVGSESESTKKIENYWPTYMWSNGSYYPLFWNAPTRFSYGYRNPYYIPALYDYYLDTYNRYPYVRYY